MSSAMENRAAVFTSQPQVVEVYRAGVWWPGELLGWRHDDTGACEVRVRMAVSGVVQTTWTDLATLRLPEPRPAASAAPPAPAAQVAPTMVAVRVVPIYGGVAVEDGDSTASLPLKRDHLRRPPVARAGGRRRAPEGMTDPATGAPPVPRPSSGRHRASGEVGNPAAGRHRATDAGILATVGVARAGGAAPVRAEAPSTVVWPVRTTRPPRSAETAAAGRGGASADHADADLLTRPMRLGEHLAPARRPG